MRMSVAAAHKRAIPVLCLAASNPEEFAPFSVSGARTRCTLVCSEPDPVPLLASRAVLTVRDMDGSRGCQYPKKDSSSCQAILHPPPYQFAGLRSVGLTIPGNGATGSLNSPSSLD
ncbi:hypothetical protein Bbelb_262630 [Branchiostoma belcheri]|nr:hypothetical protein Bbelb_262630 [Branchiostoma belcheri]